MRKPLLACWLAVCAWPLAAQKPLTAVEILSLEEPGNVRLSPDGSQVLFELSTADWKANRRVSHLWRVPAAGGEMVKMSNGSGESGAAWSPDGARFAFLRRAGDRAQAFVQRLAGGEAEQWTRHETPVSRLTWSKDGSRLYFVAPDKAPARSPGLDDAFLFERNRQDRHLWEVSLGDDRQERRLTEGLFDVREYSLSPDGRSILYVAAPSPLLDDTVHAEIYRLELAAGTVQRLTDNAVGENDPRLSPDGG
jgi:Tol biopolymer transport system component